MKIEELYREQAALAKRSILVDSFQKAELIGGADCSYIDDRIIGGIVVLDHEFNIVEKSYDVLDTTFPYISGLLAYREAKAEINAYKKLRLKPDILMVDGFGANHPRRCGIATHIGVTLDIPTIGVGKSFLCGTILDGYVYQQGERVGKLVRSGRHTRPIYVSPGHRVSLSTSVDIVVKCIKVGKIPEPVRFAHEYVTTLKREISPG